MSNLKTSHTECTAKIPYTEYAKINKGFMKFIMQQVIAGETVELPARMGSLLIKGRKITPVFNEKGEIGNLAPDWVSTKKLWDSNPEAKAKKQLVFHFNEHTAGIRYKICWIKGMTGAVNKTLYLFKPSRQNRRTAWKSILAGKEYYVAPKYYNNGHKQNIGNQKEK